MIKQRNDNLTKEQELELGAKIQRWQKLKARVEAGYELTTDEDFQVWNEGEEAFEILVGNYYDLARNIAHRHHKRTGTKYAIEDLIQDAIVALCESAYSYDPSKDCKLSTHAYYGITKKVSTTINKQRLVRMPENKMGEYNEILKAQKEYNDLVSEGQRPEITELEFIYENVDLPQSEINLILSNMQATVSLNATINENGGELLGIVGESFDHVEADRYTDLDPELARMIADLTPFERDLIAYEFGAFPASMEYADFLVKYDMTDRRVKSATRRTIKKMRDKAEEGVV